MRGHGSKFTNKMESAVAAMLSPRNVDEAALSVGISTATLMRWQKAPEFQIAYREARRAAFGQSVARLQQASGAAVSTHQRTSADWQRIEMIRVVKSAGPPLSRDPGPVVNLRFFCSCRP